MKGYVVKELFFNPNIDKPIEEIYRDMDRFTYEYYPDQPLGYEEIECWQLLPPLHYEGKFVKGLFVSTSMDFIIQRYPEIKELFVTVASPRWSGYPWSRLSDVVMASYNNPHRDAWFYNEYPDRQHQQISPLEQEVDYLNEYQICPPWAYVEKDIDVICVSRMHDQKNVPIVAEAASIYSKKYNRPDFKMVLVIGKDFDDKLNGLDDHERDQLFQTYKAVQDNQNILQIFPKRDYNRELFDLYSHAKVNVVGSLMEGKCRAQREAQFCNTPSVCFKALNQYARGNDIIYPEASGLLAPEFDAESMADTWHTVIQNQDAFSPRKTALELYGRKNYVKNLVTSIPYFQEAIPDMHTTPLFENVWLDVALMANYQTSLYDYTYGKRYDLSYVRTLEGIKQRLNYYFDLFDVNFASKNYAFAPNSPLEVGV